LSWWAFSGSVFVFRRFILLKFLLCFMLSSCALLDILPGLNAFFISRQVYSLLKSVHNPRPISSSYARRVFRLIRLLSAAEIVPSVSQSVRTRSGSVSCILAMRRGSNNLEVLLGSLMKSDTVSGSLQGSILDTIPMWRRRAVSQH
jgi:hypothetical protein